ncbi:MAG: DUF1540 domain-containing protein [Bacteriovoracaceae bacterium]
MQNINLEISLVQKCDVEKCAFNNDHKCHAKAITIGDSNNPGCDTLMINSKHAQNTQRIAGVGACKVSHCQFNNDYECTADQIQVGFSDSKVHCLTYESKRQEPTWPV